MKAGIWDKSEVVDVIFISPPFFADEIKRVSNQMKLYSSLGVYLTNFTSDLKAFLTVRTEKKYRAADPG